MDTFKQALVKSPGKPKVREIIQTSLLLKKTDSRWRPVIRGHTNGQEGTGTSPDATTNFGPSTWYKMSFYRLQQASYARLLPGKANLEWHPF